ncbi:metallophosphoesterase family protein [Serratia proteamaculans]|jgi:predicted phosphodiesterase|uniref:metallophosphoesterase family protein n=1 Tax=Serratia proteamaculans TaxID=28151 RepID=UPI003CFD028F
MNRREFLILSSGVILSGCDLLSVDKKKPKLTFIAASDGHYGEQITDYKSNYNNFINAANEFHKNNSVDFCVINGDIVHDDKKYFTPAKKQLDLLKMKYFVSKGNHDPATPDEWLKIWGYPMDFDFTINNDAFLIMSTSDLGGRYLCPDISWLSLKLAEHKSKKNIFIFMHINPASQTKFSVECNSIISLLKQYKNVRAIFNGHDHDHDEIILKDGIPFVFDSHFGGSWGTDYHGFRVVELYDDGNILTYMMNPHTKIKSGTL